MTRYVFSSQAYRRDGFVPVPTESIGLRCEFLEKIRARPSALFRSALESIDAAVALLALGQVSQSFLLFSQAAEVSLKAILDEVKRMGLAAWAAANPTFMRTLAAGSRASVPGSVKDATFIAAFRDVAEFVDFSDAVRSSIDGINRTRNEIAHRGGDPERSHHYLELILTALLPLLDEVYRRTMTLDLADFLLHDIARELIVAAKFVVGRRNDPRSWAVALRPLRAAHHHRWPTDQGIPLDCGVDDWGKSYPDSMRSEWEQHVSRTLPENVLDNIYTTCRICDGVCFLATDGELKGDGADRHFDILALACAYCGLRIREGYTDLARIHYGPIDEAFLGAEKWAQLLDAFGYQP
jgi:hypothetical protein